MSIFWLCLNLMGGLAVFLYGMQLMSEGLQKAAGNKLRNMLNMATSNRFSSTVVGFLMTCVVQSSSATTVMVVSFCNAGLLSLYQSLGIIFGANIGTTTTGWLISLLGFKVKITTFALPIIGIGFFSQFIKKWKWPDRLGEVMVGFGLLFFGLSIIKQTIPNVTESESVMNMITSFHPENIGSRLMIVMVGAVLTMIFQSSSAMMAVTLAAAASGLIGFQSAAALVLGENVGTTLTANIASVGGTITAKRAARGHFIFNIVGVIWSILFFGAFIKFIDFLIPGNPYGKSETALLVAIPTHIAAFHTVFNVINTGLALLIIKPLEKIILFIVPDAKTKEDTDLVYLTTPFSHAPELAVNAARQEVHRMAGLVVTMLDKITHIINGNGDDFESRVTSILDDEKMTDRLEHKINSYLADLTHAHLSTESNRQVISMLSMINDLERMGDHGEKLASLISRTRSSDLKFSDEGLAGLNEMAKKTKEIVTGLEDTILNPNNEKMDKARLKEDQLNSLRNKIREAHIQRIANGQCDPYAGIIFTDMLTSFEKMGDHAFNVTEAAVGIK